MNRTRGRSDSATSGYRPEVDGLRAVAIISVVAFHVGLPGFSGGFIGVDVFFVISGFLITRLLLGELRQCGSIDVLAFLARRVRRLLPAFFLVVSVTLLLGSFFLTPINEEQQGLADSAMAAAFHISNLYFGLGGDGYFEPDSSLFPLLHTWSLAVEEQFYLLWPLLLLGAAWAAGRTRFNLTWVIAGLLAGVFLASLSYICWAAEAGQGEERFAFFALRARAWEFAIGATLALVLPTVRQSGGRAGTLLAASGVIAIGIAAAAFHKEMPFPGIAALVPTLGAGAIIAGVWLAPHAIMARLLASRPLVGIGLLSYSWYLWHWPLLAIARAYELGVNNLWRNSAIALAALGAAWVTYFVVEEPVRRRRIGLGWSNLKVLGASATTSLLIIAVAQGLHAQASQMAKDEHFVALGEATLDKGWSRERCENHARRFRTLVPKSDCMRRTDPGRKILLLWGDSHADHATGMFEDAEKVGPVVLLPRWMPGCPPLLNVIVAKSEPCTRFNHAVLAEIQELQQEGRLAGVVLSARWSDYLDRPSLAGEAGRILWQNGQPARGELAAGVLAHSLQSTLRELAARKIETLVIAPMPEQQFEVPSCLAKLSRQKCSVSRELAEEHREPALQAMQQAIDSSPGAYLWDPLPILCDERRCLAEREGVPLYRDDDHLTYTASRQLAPYLQRTDAWLALIGPGLR